MLKSIKLFILFLTLTTSSVFASHYMGGEITWQCLGNGKYRFIMKLYRECNGIDYPNTVPMDIDNYSGLSSITMTLLPGANPLDAADGLLDGLTDISPNCFNPALEIHCTPNPTTANTGAIEEWYYTSDAAYPTGVQLTGVPPAAGWIFSYTSCCRNPCSNLGPTPAPSSMSWFLRAIMYPYNATNAFPCYDNSPQFAETPSTVICLGYPFKYNHNAFDKELDSLAFEWAPALDGAINTPCAYVPGYLFNSPLPGPVQNPSNVAATMNPYNGEISYTSYTSGAFVTVTKVAAYRCGIKIAEIFREMQIVLLACPGTNIPPAASGPFYNPITGLMEFIDTVYAGDVVDFDITSIDYGTLPNGNPQTVTLEASGQDFGAGFTNPNAGCVRPPCATLNPPPIISAMMAVATHFHWQTTCDHLTHPASISGIPGICGTLFNVHNFIIKMYDNACPAPGIQVATISVVVLPLQVLEPPELTCVELQSNGDITLNWAPPLDSMLTFNSYHVYLSNSPTGPFTQIDSIFDYNTTSKTYTGLNGCNGPVYFFMKTRSGCYGKYYSTTNSDTLTNILLDVTVNSLGNVAQLAWNPIHNPLPGSSSQWYQVYREFPAGSWSLIDSTQQLNYNDTIYVCNATVNYRIEIADTNGCKSVSCIDGASLQDAYPPDNISLDSVSVDNAIGKAILGWQPSTSLDVVKYYIYYKTLGGIWVINDSVNIPNTSYVDFASNPSTQSESYSIAAVDSCKKLSPMSAEHKTIYLSPIVLNACADRVSLSWSGYINFNPPLGGYRIMVSENGGPVTLLGNTSPSVTTFEHLGVTPNSQYCYYIQAFDSLNLKSSSSNIQCVLITKPNQPKYVYMRYATVNNNESVKIGFYVDTTAFITRYKVLRSEDGVIFDTIALLPPNNLLPNISFEDPDAFVTEKSYYYKVVVVDSCNIDILTSNIGRTIYLNGNLDEYLYNYMEWNNYESRFPQAYNLFREVEQFEPYTKIQSLIFNETSYTDNVENYTESGGRFKYLIQARLSDIFASDTLVDTVYSNEIIILQPPRLYVPNAFTPDGLNSIFKPIGVFTEKDNYKFVIYNRWGEVVFETMDYNQGWDGKYNGKPAEFGVYSYYIHITNAFDKTFNKRGTVMLIR